MPTLESKNVFYHYDGTNKNVLCQVHAGFEEDMVYTIIGKSGSGKSILLFLISGLDLCTDGEILYKGKI